MSDLPQFQLIEPGDPECTAIRINSVLALLQSYAQAREASKDGFDDNLSDPAAWWGQIYVLDQCRTAIHALGNMAMPQNVAKMEGRS